MITMFIIISEVLTRSVINKHQTPVSVFANTILSIPFDNFFKIKFAVFFIKAGLMVVRKSTNIFNW